MKPGFKTSEFWTSLVAQALALCTILGVISSSDTQALQDTLGKCITAVFALTANAFVVISYIRARFHLKAWEMDKVGQAPGEAEFGFKVPQAPSESGEPHVKLPLSGPFKKCCWLLAAAGVLLVGGQARAQSVLPWRSGILQQIREHEQKIAQLHGRNQAPAPVQPAPQIILVPQQTLPIQGRPEQAFPIQGKPEQTFPIQGQPRQDFPVEGAPKQQLPIQGVPKQELPIPGQPQPLPVVPPAASQGPQVYSVHRALHKPID